MKQFLTDYKGLVIKPQMQFIKSHWKGLIVFYAIYGICVYVFTKLQCRKIEKQVSKVMKDLGGMSTSSQELEQ